ncbi:hypothetical protein [Planktothrix mougeotii]|uniref:Uncharacterized protein n=1 Tax=Planktothrix mougeotii LEGE 06226 TaxID=1828728 RepID=A0ABR9U6P1_9CYAN|nr:hypothetical protein [Planktothrix mougeotii]MBE9142135.1 hypothetical protein [Planktothrix mougeotii LEGE 06226]
MILGSAMPTGGGYAIARLKNSDRTLCVIILGKAIAVLKKERSPELKRNLVSEITFVC